MKRHALFIVPQIGFNYFELITIRKKLEKNHIRCSIASYSKGTVISKDKKTLNAEHIICELKAADFDCLIFVGGENISNLAKHKCIIKLIQESYKEKRLIALLCLNSALLLPKAGLMEGRKVTVFETRNNWSREHVLEKKGILIEEPVVIDENIITCKDEKDAGLIADKILERLL